MHRAVIPRAGGVIGVSENVLTRALGLLGPTTEPGRKKTLGQGVLEARKVTVLPFILLFSFHCVADGGIGSARPQEPQLSGHPCARFCT